MMRLGKWWRWRPRGSTLLVLSLLLIGSAVFRLGFEAAPAIAREIAQERPEVEPEVSSEPAPPDMVEAEYREMLELFARRDQELRRREAELQDRMQAVTVAEAAIKKQLDDLVAAEERLRATLAIADGAAEGDISRLTAVYERMKPKEAAALFEEMDPQFAAGFLARMKPEIAAGVLANLNPNAAYSISVVLAGRNARAPKE